jgi:hypothetical protein
VTDSIIYEAQPMPPEDPHDRGRQRRVALLGGVAVVALLIAGVVLGAALFRGGDDTEPLTDPTTSTQPSNGNPTPTTTASSGPFADRLARSESDGRLFGGGDYATSPARPGGGADVGTPTPPLPQQSFEWQKITLDLPAGEEAYLQGVYEIDDGFVAIGMGWSEAQGQTMRAWRSPDGRTWERTSLNGDFSGASVWNVQFNEHGGIAFGEIYSDFGGDEPVFRGYAAPQRVVWTTRDGVNWTRSEVSLTTEPNQSVWLNTGVAGPSEFAVIGHRETSPEFEPIVFEKDGYTITLSEYSFTYQVTDASGTVVAEGSMEDFYGYHEEVDGQVVVDPETGEILTVVPWEDWEKAWEAAYADSRGGPFGGFESTAPIVTIEYDGYRITVDEELFTYTIEDIATGQVISSGDADYLWRGPAPIIRDGDGTELFRISWEEFDTAQNAFWEDREHDYEYKSSMVVAVSTDGINWTESTVASDAQEVSLDSIIARENGYLAYGSQWDEYTGGSAVWSSPDGLTWTQVADMPGGMYIWNVQQAPDGTLLALGDGPQGQALWSSVDGISWGEAFGTRIPEDRTVYEWMNQFGTGRLGTVVIGSREQHYYDEELYAEPLTITKDGHTLTFDDYDEWPPQVIVTDDATGEVVIDVKLAEGENFGLPEGFSWEDGVTTISRDGVVLMTISDDEFYAAQEERWMTIEGSYDYARPQVTMYFSTDLGEWTEVPVDFQGWISHVAVGAETVILAGEEYVEPPTPVEEYYGEGEDLMWEPPTPILFVGRPTG